MSGAGADSAPSQHRTPARHRSPSQHRTPARHRSPSRHNPSLPPCRHGGRLPLSARRRAALGACVCAARRPQHCPGPLAVRSTVCGPLNGRPPCAGRGARGHRPTHGLGNGGPRPDLLRRRGAHSGPMPCSTSRRSAIDRFPSAAGLPLPRHTKQPPTAPAGEATTLCTGRRSNDLPAPGLEGGLAAPRCGAETLCTGIRGNDPLPPHAKQEPRAAPCEAKGLCLGMAGADAHLGREADALRLRGGRIALLRDVEHGIGAGKGSWKPSTGILVRSRSRANPRRLPCGVTATPPPGSRAAQVTPEIPPGRPMARRPAFDAQLAVSSTLRAGGPRSVGHRVPCGQSVAASPVSPASPGRPRSVGRRVAGGQSVAASAAVSRSPRGRGPAHAPGPRRPVRASPS